MSKAIFVAATLAGGMALFYALLVRQATLSFWTVESLELMNILTYGSTVAGEYPLSIYKAGFRTFFTFVVPLACLNTISARALLSNPAPQALFLAPLAGFAFLAAALQVWRLGVRHYTSTGS